MTEVLVLVDHVDGQVAKTTFELLTLAAPLVRRSLTLPCSPNV